MRRASPLTYPHHSTSQHSVSSSSSSLYVQQRPLTDDALRAFDPRTLPLPQTGHLMPHISTHSFRPSKPKALRRFSEETQLDKTRTTRAFTNIRTPPSLSTPAPTSTFFPGPSSPTFSTPLPALSHSNASVVDSASPVAQLEKEYVANLQQQIYFLELEVDLLKQSPASSTTSAASTDPDAPLDNVMVSLREKFITQKEEGEKERAQKEKELLEMTEKAEIADIECERQRIRYEDSKEKMTVLKEEYRKARIDAGMNAKLAEEQRELIDRMQREYNDKISSLEQQNIDIVARGKSNTAHHQHQMEQMKNEVEIMKADVETHKHAHRDQLALILDLENQVKHLPYHQLREEYLVMQRKLSAAEKQLQKSELLHEESEAKSARVHTRCEELIEENHVLKAKLSHFNDADLITRHKLHINDKGADAWSEELVELRVKVKHLSREAAIKTEVYEKFEKECVAMKRQCAVLEHKLEQHENAVILHKKQQSEAMEEIEKRGEAMRQLQVDHQLLQKDHAQCDNSLLTLRNEKDTLRETNNRLERAVAKLQRDNDLQDALKSIDVQEFNSMAQQNIKVAEAIGKLVGTISAMDHTGSGFDIVQATQVKEVASGGLESARSDVWAACTTVAPKPLSQIRRRIEHQTRSVGKRFVASSCDSPEEASQPSSDSEYNFEQEERSGSDADLPHSEPAQESDDHYSDARSEMSRYSSTASSVSRPRQVKSPDDRVCVSHSSRKSHERTKRLHHGEYKR